MLQWMSTMVRAANLGAFSESKFSIEAKWETTQAQRQETSQESEWAPRSGRGKWGLIHNMPLISITLFSEHKLWDHTSFNQVGLSQDGAFTSSYWFGTWAQGSTEWWVYSWQQHYWTQMVGCHWSHARKIKLLTTILTVYSAFFRTDFLCCR